MHILSTCTTPPRIVRPRFSRRSFQSRRRHRRPFARRRAEPFRAIILWNGSDRRRSSFDVRFSSSALHQSSFARPSRDPRRDQAAFDDRDFTERSRFEPVWLGRRFATDRTIVAGTAERTRRSAINVLAQHWHDTDGRRQRRSSVIPATFACNCRPLRHDDEQHAGRDRRCRRWNGRRWTTTARGCQRGQQL